MRVVFLGTPDFAVPSLEALAASHELVLVLTRPDAIRARGKRAESSPVKARALELGLEVRECARVDGEILERVRACRPDVVCVAAFGCILPDELLEMAPLGAINVHASLLPRWRGAAPIQRAILAGDAEAGISIMRVVSKLDAGPYCAQASIGAEGMCTSELTHALAELGAEELLDSLEDIASGSVVWTEQDEARATYAAKVTKDEMLLSPDLSARENSLRVLASSDTAPARASVAERPLRVTDACEDALRSLNPGEVSLEKGRVFLGCTGGGLELLSVKPDGKREMDARAFAAGLHGALLGWERL